MTTAASRINELLDAIPALKLGSLNLLRQPGDPMVVAGTIHPFKNHSVEEIARLIHAGGPYRIDTGGAIETVDPTQIANCKPPVKTKTIPRASFRFEMWVFESRRHPLFYGLVPQISRATHPTHPHLLEVVRPADPQVQALCVYPPHLELWDAIDGQLYTPVAWLATWFASHHIWSYSGTWLGRKTPHTLEAIWRKFGGNECWCGSTKPMGECDRHPHLGPQSRTAILSSREDAS